MTKIEKNIFIYISIQYIGHILAVSAEAKRLADVYEPLLPDTN